MVTATRRGGRAACVFGWHCRCSRQAHMHKRRFPLVLVIAIALASISGRRAATQDLDANLALFERYTDAQRRIAHVPGLSGVILRDGRPIWMRGFGFQDVDARVP